ncbi:TM2 domain-containing protein [Algivirga pacifica]|uniref:TM2 domain-containing protein n=1 Tax=Algivirga pacifica TaxID=1162670 RepID=A0ABP9DI35_9BACT
MKDTIIPYYLGSTLPYEVVTKVTELPEEAQQEFLGTFHYMKKSPIISYILHFFLGAHHGYMGEWGKQILFWLTGGGFGIWWLILTFTIPRNIRRRNREISKDVLKDVLLRYRKRQNKALHKEPARVASKRTLNIPFDPTDLRLENLEKGFMIDFETETWEVLEKQQMDWQNDESHFFYHLIHGSQERYLYLHRGRYFTKHYLMKSVNKFILHENLEALVAGHKRPPNILEYEGASYYKEAHHYGFGFDHNHPSGIKEDSWIYYDEQQQNVLLIVLKGKSEVKTYAGKIKDAEEFIDILPR